MTSQIGNKMRANITEIITLKPDTVGWTKDLEVKTLSINVVGSPDVQGGKIINSEFKVKDINVLSSAVITVDVSAKIKADTYYGLKQDLSRIYYTILNNIHYSLDMYIYNPDYDVNASSPFNQQKILYSDANFPYASYMSPFSDSTRFKWLITSSEDLEDGKSQEVKLLKLNGEYSKNIKLVFRSMRLK